MYYSNITAAIGNTPLVRLSKLQTKLALAANLYAKLEMFNPGGSVKDRIALKMINQAQAEHRINPETVIIEPTSGNTGIGLALVSAYYGYQLILVMPDSLSQERRELLQAYGAKIVLTPGAKGMKEAIRVSKKLAEDNPNSFIPSQFDNLANPNSHYETTGPEIYRDCPEVDVLISAIGTGGTITGVGRYLKEQNPAIHIIGVEPAASPFLTQGITGKHKIQGLGAGFLPAVLDTNVYDEIIPIADDLAIDFMRLLTTNEGIFAGISSGAALAAGVIAAKQQKFHQKNIVVILPDSGDRYLSLHLMKDPQDD